MAFSFMELDALTNYSKDANTEHLERTLRVNTNDPVAAMAYGPSIGDTWLSWKVVSKRVDHVGPNFCKLIITYETKATAEEDEPVIEFDTSAQTENIKRALQQIDYPVSADVHKLINVDKDEIRGLDIYIPAFEWCETRIWNTTPTAVDINVYYTYTGKVNNAAWKIFGPREALFVGCRGRQLKKDKWELVYRFLGQPSVSFWIDDLSITVNKVGWDYIWYEYSYGVTSGVKAPKVKAVHYARVYDAANFANLGIGV